MKNGFLTKIGIFLLKIVATFPFWLIYLLSDIFFFIIFYVVGYRKKVVYQNLKNSFPSKTDSELKAIQKKFFKHLADQILESVKMHRMSESDFNERFILTNPMVLTSWFEQNKSIVLLTMHYNNWEYGCSIPLQIKHKLLGVYKPLHNQHFDVFANRARARMGAEMVKNSAALRRIIRAEKQNEPVITWLAADQTPHPSDKFWFRFLNQDTIFYQGGAYIARRFNHPVFFQKIEKTSRGKYKVTFELLFDDPGKYSDAEIFSAFINKMERIINETPEYYLWSHRRWKHKKPDHVKLLNE